MSDVIQEYEALRLDYLNKKKNVDRINGRKASKTDESWRTELAIARAELSEAQVKLATIKPAYKAAKMELADKEHEARLKRLKNNGTAGAFMEMFRVLRRLAKEGLEFQPDEAEVIKAAALILDFPVPPITIAMGSDGVSAALDFDDEIDHQPENINHTASMWKPEHFHKMAVRR